MILLKDRPFLKLPQTWYLIFLWCNRYAQKQKDDSCKSLFCSDHRAIILCSLFYCGYSCFIAKAMKYCSPLWIINGITIQMTLTVVWDQCLVNARKGGKLRTSFSKQTLIGPSSENFPPKMKGLETESPQKIYRVFPSFFHTFTKENYSFVPSRFTS